MRLRSLFPFIAAVIAGCGGGLKHELIVPGASRLATAPDIGSIGRIVSITSYGGTVYVGGQSGVAALDAKGSVLWKTAQTPALIRYVSADAGGVVAASFNMSAVEPVKGYDKFVSGGFKEGDYEAATVTSFGTDGSIRWSKESPEQSWLSPPALHAKAVGVLSGKRFTVYDRQSGDPRPVELEFTVLGMTAGASDGIVRSLPRRQPAVLKDDFYATFGKILIQVGIDGTRRFSNDTFKGMLRSWHGIFTSNPVAAGELVVAAHRPDDGSAIDGIKPDASSAWRTGAGGIRGCFDLVADESKLYLSCGSNIIALKFDGDEEWTASSPLFEVFGATAPSKLASTFTVGAIGDSKLDETRRTAQTFQLPARGRLFVASRTERDHDVVTVLDASNGKYVKTLDIKEPIVGLAAVGQSIVVATAGDLRFIDVE